MADDLTLLPTVDTSDSPRPLAGARRVRPESIYDLGADQLKQKIRDLGAPSYRAGQIVRWLYDPARLAASFAEMSDLPLKLRELLQSSLQISVLQKVRELRTDNGDTIKTLYRTVDGQFIETVLMLYADRS